MLGALALANLLAWMWAAAVFRGQSALLAMALLAYAFGLRHALDADHIAAIDNVTRRFVHQGRRPVAVGFFFSVGHSTVVVLACLAIGLASHAVQAHLGVLRAFGEVAGALVSATFLFTVAGANLPILLGRAGPSHDDGPVGGLLGRALRPVLAFVSSSWRMAPVGFLFGLGFDTASEIGLLGLSAAHTGLGSPLVAMTVFPALFAAGMSLVDSIDSVMMLKAYGWAELKPRRKLLYNRTVTALSVVLAFGVGMVELLDLLRTHADLRGRLWSLVGSLSDNFELLGAVVVAGFALIWGASLLITKVQTDKEVSA